jgi:uncharacterized membrane protein YfcA
LTLSVMLPLLIAGDVFSLTHYVRRLDVRNLAMLVPGLLVGVGLGYVALGWFLALPDGQLWMKRIIGSVSVGLVGVQCCRMAQERRVGAGDGLYRPRYWHGISVGAGAGLTSTLAHAGGPFIALFLLPQRLEKQVFVGTMLAYFFIGNLAKVVPYAVRGLFTAHSLMLAAVLVPCVALGAVLGVALNRRISIRAFQIAVYALTVCLGLYLLSGWEPGSGGSQDGEAGAAAAHERGLAAFRAGSYLDAASAFAAAAAQAGPWQDGAAFDRGLALYEAGSYEDARQAFARLDRSPEGLLRLRAAFNMGNCACRLGRADEAVELYRKVGAECRAALTEGRRKGSRAEREVFAELLARASYNQAVAQGALRPEPADGAAERPSSGTGDAPPGHQGATAQNDAGGTPGPPAAGSGLGATGGAEQGEAHLDAVLDAVSARDTGPLLGGRRVRRVPVAEPW